jgi:hypothetical protein
VDRVLASAIACDINYRHQRVKFAGAPADFPARTLSTEIYVSHERSEFTPSILFKRSKGFIVVIGKLDGETAIFEGALHQFDYDRLVIHDQHELRGDRDFIRHFRTTPVRLTDGSRSSFPTVDLWPTSGGLQFGLADPRGATLSTLSTLK